jgi:hypothetical protein
MTGKELFELVREDTDLVYALTQDERWDLSGHCQELSIPFYRRRRSPPCDVVKVMTALEFAAESLAAYGR